MQGWIKLHRKIMCSEVFQNEKLFKVFMYCLLKSSHSEHELKVGRQKVKLLPGQFVFGRKKAALELDMKESSVRDYIEILKSDNVIDVKSTNKYSVITVVNWEVYQSKEEDSDNKNDSKSDSKKTAKRQQINTNNNDKNDKNVEEIKDIYTFWNLQQIIVHRELPNKMKSIINARLKNYSLEELKKAISNYKEILNGDLYYWTHKWTLTDFMKSDNVVKFMDTSDPFKVYLDKSKKVYEERPVPVLSEEQKLKQRMQELDGILSLGEEYFADDVEEYRSAVKEYEEIERKLQAS